jgi:hypothetical protein
MQVGDYLKSDFAKDKRARRAWLAAGEVFKTGKNGDELTPAGRKAIDAAMSEFVEVLANSPLMIEGYAAEGTPDQRYRTARQRGLLVQSYLQQQFGLKPKFVGTIPLVEGPPPKSGKPSWDGVALVLLPAG